MVRSRVQGPVRSRVRSGPGSGPGPWTLDKSSPPTCHLLRSTCAEKSPAFSSSDSSSSRGGPVTFPRGLLLFPPSSVVHKLRGSLRRNARPALKSNLRASSPSVPVPGSLHPASVPGGSPPVVQALPDSPLVPRRSQESAWSARSATIQLMNPMSGPDRTGPDPYRTGPGRTTLDSIGFP